MHWRQLLTGRITRDSVSHRLPYAVALQQNVYVWNGLPDAVSVWFVGAANHWLLSEIVLLTISSSVDTCGVAMAICEKIVFLTFADMLILINIINNNNNNPLLYYLYNS